LRDEGEANIWVPPSKPWDESVPSYSKLSRTNNVLMDIFLETLE